MGLRKGFTFVCVILTATALKLAGQAEKSPRLEELVGNYDRIELTSKFLRAVYPELAQAVGMLTLDAVFPDSGEINFTLRRCRAGSGIAGGEVPGTPARPRIPNCWPPPSQEESLLSAEISFGEDRHRPILRFNVTGTFIMDPGLQAVRDQFKGKAYSEYDMRDKQRYWTEEDAVEALRSKNPKYGPEHKKDFLSILPIDTIRKLTGCKLRPNSATFDVKLQPSSPPTLEWVVHGDAAATESLKETECWAYFEPFEGRLTAMGGFSQH
jgi:hypothetical protein